MGANSDGDREALRMEMSHRLIFKRVAREEYFEAVAWYETQRSGLGREFAQEVDRVLKRALANPEQFRKVRPSARKARLDRFPYNIYFAVKGDVFSVLAVFHGPRHPRELSKRL